MDQNTNLLLRRITSWFGARPCIDVNVLGASERNSILGSTRLYQQRKSSLLNEDAISRLAKQGQQEIANAMQGFGYYKAKVDMRDEIVNIEGSWHGDVNVCVLSPEDIKRLDPEGLAFENVNTPEEFDAAANRYSG